MANRLLSRDEIVEELRRLDDVEGRKAGYYVGDLEIIRKIDGKKTLYGTIDLTMTLDDFSTRILRPLICQPRGPADIPSYRLGLPPEQVRGSTHGDYTHMSITIQNIKNAMHSGEAWGMCSAMQREALELIATKIGRIVCGDSNCIDHWDDVIGYATLARDRIPKEKT